MSGRFVTFEGCEGVGKSKQIKLLAQYLQASNQDALILREPGGTTISEGIRNLILDTNNKNMTSESELILYIAARAQLVGEIIRPALNAGKLVICDRFIDSTTAYQGFGRGLDVEMIQTLNSIAVAECVPDCTVFLDLEPIKAFARKGGADKGDRLESEDITFHNRVYQGYKYVEGKDRHRIIAIAPLGTVQDTHLKIINALKAKGMIV